MENLKGKTILIGKDPSESRLLVALLGGKAAAIGSAGSVPKSVSRCMLSSGIAHAKITVDLSGNMILTNMKSQNVTFVNGSQVESKRIAPSSIVELGKDHYRLNLSAIIETAKKLGEISINNSHNNPIKNRTTNNECIIKTFNIRHLNRVWDKYHQELLKIKQNQKKQQTYSRLPTFFTMGSGIIGGVFCLLVDAEYQEYIKICSGILMLFGLLFLFILIIKSKNDTTLDDQERAAEKFQDEYICPNPTCQKFLGNLSYKLLKKQLRSNKDQKIHCPHCGCVYEE